MSLQRRKPLRRGKPLGRGGPLASVTALTTRTPLQRGGPIRPVSGRRRAENRVRAAMIAELTDHERPLCAVWGILQPEWCTRWADDAHEPLSRARGGSITDPANCIPICRPCHHKITFTPESELEWAYDLSLLVHSWDAEGGAA